MTGRVKPNYSWDWVNGMHIGYTPERIRVEGRGGAVEYVPEQECEFVPDEFVEFFDEKDRLVRIGKPSEDCQYFVCTKCGESLMFDWGGEGSWFEPEYPYKPFLSYCPECGAKAMFPPSWLDMKEVEE